MAHTATRAPDFAEKIVSHRHRYLWLCNPKVASRSIKNALLEADPDALLILDKSVSEVFSMFPEARRYTSFAFIRSPLERALSFFAALNAPLEPVRQQASEAVPADLGHEASLEQDIKRRMRAQLLARYYGLAQARDLDAFCEWLATPFAADACAERHIRSQHLLVRTEHGRMADFIGRLETIEEDWQRIAAHLGMDAPPLPTLNTMAGWAAPADEAVAAREALAKRMARRSAMILRSRYAEDFALEEDILKQRCPA